MNAKQQGAIVGIFASGADAQLAIDDLYYADFSEQDVGMVTRGGGVVPADTSTTTQEKSATTGAAVGIAAGGAVGAIAGLIAVNFIPGIGQIITGGALTAIILSTLAGAAGGSLIGPFVAMGLTEEEAREADRHFAEGRTLVIVRARDRAAEAMKIMAQRGAEQLRLTSSSP